MRGWNGPYFFEGLELMIIGAHTVDGSEIRLTTWDVQNLVNTRTNYQPQLVLAGFLNHQPYEPQLPNGDNPFSRLNTSHSSDAPNFGEWFSCRCFWFVNVWNCVDTVTDTLGSILNIFNTHCKIYIRNLKIIEEENHFPNLHFWFQPLIFQGV